LEILGRYEPSMCANALLSSYCISSPLSPPSTTDYNRTLLSLSVFFPASQRALSTLAPSFVRLVRRVSVGLLLCPSACYCSFPLSTSVRFPYDMGNKAPCSPASEHVPFQKTVIGWLLCGSASALIAGH
jgi:hypothetical protein